MISSKEKAQELLIKFLPHAYPFSAGSGYLTGDIDENAQKKHAKELAIICVDEIMKSEPFKPYSGAYYEIISDRTDEVMKYWDNVKTVLQSL